MRGIWLTTLLACTVCGRADAGWRYTAWGMTADAAEAASGGSLHRIQGRPARGRGVSFLLEGRHEIAGSDFNVELGFEDESGKLFAVNLFSFDSDSCAAALMALKNKATPEVESARVGMERMTWRDSESENLVQYRGNESLHRLGGKEPYCYITYRPMLGRDEGL